MPACLQCGAYYFGRDWTYRGMEIHNCTFELPGTMWTESWSFINAVYADDFGSSVSMTANTFWLGHGMSWVFAGNQGRDHHFVGNVIRPLPPSTNQSRTPGAQIGNHGCGGGADVDGYNCTGCMRTTCALQASFLKRVPFNTSAAWKRTFPRMYDFWETKPCEAGGTIIKDNVICFADTTLVAQPGYPGRSPPLTTTGSVVRNNTWIPAVCGGPAPSPPPPPSPSPSPSPSPPSPPPFPLDIVAHGGAAASCAQAGQAFQYNKTDGAISVANGTAKGRVVAVFWGNAGADGSPVTINVADGPEFTQYRNVVFELSPPNRATEIEIKLRVNGKCLTAPAHLPGQVVLKQCDSSKRQQWSLQPVGAHDADQATRWALSSGLGGCAVIGNATYAVDQ
jgi:hypothetical protein